MYTNFKIFGEMNENLYEAQYTIAKKNKVKKFYEENKILIFLIILTLIIFIGSIIFYLETKETKKILLAENYIEAKIYLENDDRNKAKNILKTIIFANDSTYSALSLFLILDENMIVDQKELSNLFDQVLENNKFEKEVKNLIIFKKALFQSNFVNQEELLEALQLLLKTETLWKSHALLLLGDYFFAKKEYLEAKKYYSQILSLKNLHNEFYEQARSQLIFITNE